MLSIRWDVKQQYRPVSIAEYETVSHPGLKSNKIMVETYLSVSDVLHCNTSAFCCH